MHHLNNNLKQNKRVLVVRVKVISGSGTRYHKNYGTDISGYDVIGLLRERTRISENWEILKRMFGMF